MQPYLWKLSNIPVIFSLIIKQHITHSIKTQCKFRPNQNRPLHEKTNSNNKMKAVCFIVLLNRKIFLNNQKISLYKKSWNRFIFKISVIFRFKTCSFSIIIKWSEFLILSQKTKHIYKTSFLFFVQKVLNLDNTYQKPRQQLEKLLLSTLCGHKAKTLQLFLWHNIRAFFSIWWWETFHRVNPKNRNNA